MVAGGGGGAEGGAGGGAIGGAIERTCCSNRGGSRGSGGVDLFYWSVEVGEKQSCGCWVLSAKCWVLSAKCWVRCVPVTVRQSDSQSVSGCCDAGA